MEAVDGKATKRNVDDSEFLQRKATRSQMRKRKIHHKRLQGALMTSVEPDDTVLLQEKDIHDRVWRHNNSPGRSWHARVHQQFIGLTHRDMMMRMGGQTYTTASQHRVRAMPDERPDHIKYAGLPSSLDWTAKKKDDKTVNYDSTPVQQGSCGSCYIFATISVAQSRFLLETGKRVAMSVQEVLSCSAYNQGCDGGYPLLAGMHGRDYGFVSESDREYSATNEGCNRASAAEHDRELIQSHGKGEQLFFVCCGVYYYV